MSKVSIVFWSGTGNTAAMAEMIAQGVSEAGGEAVLIPVGEANVEELKKEKAFALGCPSMGAEQLEEMEMEPFMCELEGGIAGKQIALFGSYGWGNQEWMRDWEGRVASAGATVVNGEGITVNGAPDSDTQEQCKSVGKALAQLA
ncbi:MAG: flavodoxin [Eubacteriales bacterium]|nr:flavodoxin [Eubacteriales bacterium]